MSFYTFSGVQPQAQHLSQINKFTGISTSHTTVPIIKYDSFTDEESHQHQNSQTFTNGVPPTSTGSNATVYGQPTHSIQYSNQSYGSNTAQVIPPHLSHMKGTLESAHCILTDEPQDSQEQPEVDLDIMINNVVCTFATRCHINLKRLATEGRHVEYKRANGMVSMKIRNPNSTASIWSSGKITCTGSTSEQNAYRASRRFARILQRLQYPVRFCKFRVVNVLGTCIMPFGIRITHFSKDHKDNASYEPELHPGVTYKIKEPKATLKIFSTGSVTVTAPSVANVQAAIVHIYPLVLPYKLDMGGESAYEKKKNNAMHFLPSKQVIVTQPKKRRAVRIVGPNDFEYDSDEDLEAEDLEDDGDFDSEDSQD